MKKMKLVIGGTAQGKLEYVLLKHDVQKNMVWDGVLPNDRELNGNIVIINHLHQWIKNCMVSGGCPEDEIMSLLSLYGGKDYFDCQVSNGRGYVCRLTGVNGRTTQEDNLQIKVVAEI